MEFEEDEKGYERGVQKFVTVEKAYITWEDNGINSSSDSKNKIINLGLMVKDYESGEE